MGKSPSDIGVANGVCLCVCSKGREIKLETLRARVGVFGKEPLGALEEIDGEFNGLCCKSGLRREFVELRTACCCIAAKSANMSMFEEECLSGTGREGCDEPLGRLMRA